MLMLAAWAAWRTVVKGDLAVGLAFYLALVLIVDSFLNTGLFIPGIEKGSIRFSEICAAFLVFRRPAAGPRHICTASSAISSACISCSCSSRLSAPTR